MQDIPDDGKVFSGTPPLCIRAIYDGSIIFLQSKAENLQRNPDVLNNTEFSDVTHKYSNPNIQADISTDDWPFFYMPQRVYPISYLWMMALTSLSPCFFFGISLASGHASSRCIFLYGQALCL